MVGRRRERREGRMEREGHRIRGGTKGRYEWYVNGQEGREGGGKGEKDG